MEDDSATQEDEWQQPEANQEAPWLTGGAAHERQLELTEALTIEEVILGSLDRMEESLKLLSSLDSKLTQLLSSSSTATQQI